MDRYLEKIETAFNGVNYEYGNLKELLNIDIDEVDNFIDYYDTNKIDFNCELFDLESRLRALRDKLDHE